MRRLEKSFIAIIFLLSFFATNVYAYGEEYCENDDAELLSYLMEKNGYKWMGGCMVKDYGTHFVYTDGAIGNTFTSGTYAFYKGNPGRIQFTTGDVRNGQTFCAMVVDGYWESIGRQCDGMGWSEIAN
jgi:hypothetical protein